MNCNLQFSGDCLKYKALEMTIRSRPLLLQKHIILEKAGKNDYSDIES